MVLNFKVGGGIIGGISPKPSPAAPAQEAGVGTPKKALDGGSFYKKGIIIRGPNVDL
jgi:hypothetical protein